MKISQIHLKDLAAIMDSLEEVDCAAASLYTKGPVIFRDGEGEGAQEFHIEYDPDGYWYLDTDKSKDIE